MQDNEDREEFSVAVFYGSGRHEYLARWLSAEAAFDSFQKAIATAGRVPGAVVKIIITDGGDMTNAMWEAGKGLTYPKVKSSEK